MQAVFKILIADQISHLVQQNRAEMQGCPFVDVVKMKLYILPDTTFFYPPWRIKIHHGVF